MFNTTYQLLWNWGCTVGVKLIIKALIKQEMQCRPVGQSQGLHDASFKQEVYVRLRAGRLDELVVL